MVKTFDDVVDARMWKIIDTLTLKSREYAVDGNRFHNFDAAGDIVFEATGDRGNSTPELALRGMMMKHIVSVFDLIDAKDEVTVELIDEKIGDTINYLILLEGLLLRRLGELS